ncbi:MAG: hypothetical protein ABIH01_01445 [Candidatus Omnitrophota bacterium]
MDPALAGGTAGLAVVAFVMLIVAVSVLAGGIVILVMSPVLRKIIKKSLLVTNANLMLGVGLLIFMSVLAIIGAPLQAKMQAAAQAAAPGAAPALPSIPVLLLWVLWILVVILAGIFINGGLLGFMKGAVAKSGAEEINKFLESGKKYYLKILGLGLVVIAYLILVVVAAALITGITGWALKFIPILMNIVLALEIIAAAAILVVGLFLVSFSPYAIVVLEEGIIDGIKKSIEFVKANALKIIGLFVIFAAIRIVANLATLLVMLLLSALPKAISIITDTLAGLINGGVSIYIALLITAAMMDLYLSSKKESAPVNKEVKPA